MFLKEFYTTCKLYSTLGSLGDYEHCGILDPGVMYDKEALKKPVWTKSFKILF
jgi:hypothetical protein